jgi:oligoendopeptidase F
MEYVRLDVDDVKSQITDIIQEFNNAPDYDAAKAAFIDMDKLTRHVDTMSTLAYLRHSIDTRDKFYDDEVTFWNNANPEIQEYTEMWTKALLASKYREKLSADFGEIIFTNAELDLKSFSPEIISQLQQENDLTQEYDKLIASSKIPFEGKNYTISQIQIHKNDADDARRLAAWKAEARLSENISFPLLIVFIKSRRNVLARNIR